MKIIKSHLPKYYKFRDALYLDNHISISGPRGVGKTCFIKTCIETDDNIVGIFIPCHNIFTKQRLLTKILENLREAIQIKAKHDCKQLASSVKSFLEIFEEYLKKMRARKNLGPDMKVMIVLDKADILFKKDLFPAIVPLLKIKSVIIVLVSTPPLSSIFRYAKLPVTAPSHLLRTFFEIYLKPWTKEEIIELILQERPLENDKVYDTFVKNVVHLTYNQESKDYSILKTLTQNIWASFIEYCNMETESKNSRRSVRNSSSSVIGFFEDKAFMKELKARQATLNKEISTDAACRLPVNLGFMVLAASIASYTKDFHDRINFVKCQKSRRLRSNEQYFNFVNEAKPFTLERLLQIFIALKQQNLLIDGRDILDQDISSVTTLVDLNIITKVSGDGLSGLSRYVIADHVEALFINRIADDINVNMTHYLPWWNIESKSQPFN